MCNLSGLLSLFCKEGQLSRHLCAYTVQRFLSRAAQTSSECDRRDWMFLRGIHTCTKHGSPWTHVDIRSEESVELIRVSTRLCESIAIYSNGDYEQSFQKGVVLAPLRTVF